MIKKIIEAFKEDPVVFMYDLAWRMFVAYLLLISVIVIFMMLLGGD